MSKRGGENAGSVCSLLAERHAKDLFVAECKLGSSWNGARRMDGWALLKTWSPFTTIGYEVKVSRQDFLGDRKWVDYLPVCHEFYFVSPAKLIAVEELPQDVGLLWTAGSRLVCKRKAARREPDPARLLPLMAYVLMSRTRIVGDMHEAARLEPRDYWRAWLQEREEDQRLGLQVSERLRKIVQTAVAARQRAENDRSRWEHIAEKLKALGLDPNAGVWQVEQRLGHGDAARKLAEIRRLSESITRLSESHPA